MDGTVGSRPSHYDALGLTPGASEEEIARAFATKMNAFRWHPAGAAAHVWIAYETLRDRIKRADYDRSLGLVPQRQQVWSMAVSQQHWTPFIASPSTSRTDGVSPEPKAESRAEPCANAPEPAGAPVDPRLESIAATVRELANPARREVPDNPRPPLLVSRRPEREADSLEPVIHQILSTGRSEKENLRYAEGTAFEWKRPVQIVGGLILGAGIFGVVLGLSARDNPAAAEAQSIPAAHSAAEKLHSSPSPPPAEPLAETTASQREATETADLFSSTSKRLVIRRPAPFSAMRSATRSPTAESSAVDNPPEAAASDDQAAADPLAPQPAAAKLPLSNSVIAHTIDRIGYRCGEVASTAPVEGAAPGTFSVTCSSGQTYQATPLHGRYRFRRSGRD
jgi:hypothetical protein